VVGIAAVEVDRVTLVGIAAVEVDRVTLLRKKKLLARTPITSAIATLHRFFITVTP
jgi:hypothetical protein